MRIRTALAFATLLLATAPAGAVTGTCTITQLDVVGSYLFPIPNAVGGTLGTEVTGGTFSLDRTPFDQQFPSPGVDYSTLGIVSYLTLGSGVAPGTIDSTGNVAVPGMSMSFGTSFGVPDGDPPYEFPLVVNLMTGMQAPVLSGKAVLLEGRPLDATGKMRMLGAGIVNFQGTNLTGPGLSCTLSPAPDLATLPAGPSLTAVKGKAVIGAEPAVNDDELTLTAKLKHGETPPSLDGSQDVILRLRAGGGDFITAMLVQQGKFVVKGKQATATDVDGKAIVVLTPFDNLDDSPKPVTGGKLTIKRGKKSSTFVWKVQGLDLEGFTGTVNVAIAVGTQTTTRDITVTSGKKSLKFK